MVQSLRTAPKSMSDSPPRNHQERFATSSRRTWILQTLNAVNCWIWWAVRFPRRLPPDVSAWHGLDDLGVQSTEKNHQSTRQALVNYTDLLHSFSVFYTVYIKMMVIFVIQTCWQWFWGKFLDMKLICHVIICLFLHGLRVAGLQFTIINYNG